MMEDSLKITSNPDGTFTMDWDPKDPKWNWLNGKTAEEISAIVSEAVRMELEKNEQ